MPKSNIPRIKKFAGVSREGWPFVFIGFFTFIVLLRVHIGLGAAMGLVLLWVTWFFRDPEREPEQHLAPEDVVCPADGVVLSIDRCSNPFDNTQSQRVAIFMNIFNVHVNRAPVSGVVTDVYYSKGKFLSAFKSQAAVENERNAVQIETALGDKLSYVQIAGLIARRIVSRVDKGEKLEQGERVGLIRFGSRVDLYLPLTYELKVAKREKVFCGRTCIAKRAVQK